MGPGYMVSVGYMDPGNWATDLAGGAQFGYTLLFVIMLSNLMAILLQALAARLGIASGTVKNHRARIYEKLDITTERELFLHFFHRSQPH